MVTAETAISTIAAVAVFALLLGGIQYLVGSARVEQMAGASARMVSRGDDPAAITSAVRRALPGASVEMGTEQGSQTVIVAAPLHLPGGAELTIRGSAEVVSEVLP